MEKHIGHPFQRNNHIDISSYAKMDFATVAPLLISKYSIPDFNTIPRAQRDAKKSAWLNDHKEIIQGCNLLFVKEAWDFVKKSPEFDVNKVMTIDQVRDFIRQSLYRAEMQGMDEFSLLKLYSLLQIGGAVQQWTRVLDRQLEQESDNDPKLTTYLWLTEVYQEVDTGTPYLTPGDVIKSGFGTALQTIWNTLDVAPAAYDAEQGSRRTQKGTEDVDLRSVIYFLARGNQNVVVRALGVLCNLHYSHTNIEAALARFDPSYFEMGEESTKRTLNIKSSAFGLLQQSDGSPKKIADIMTSSDNTGCPALLTSAIRELFDWSDRLYRKFNLPVVPGTNKY